jgi:hypothetical protein
MQLLNAIKTVRLFQEKENLISLWTRWGKSLDKKHILQEYPRPQMKRDNYQMLNGLWDYCFSKTTTFPDVYEGKILVPFSPESQLSQVERQLQPDEYLWYQTSLDVSPSCNKRCLLHFGAVDQIADVYINQLLMEHHVGGYLPFTIDITDALKEKDNLLTVCVQDLSDTSYHSKGKQRLNRGGMYYTAQSGIWQSVWLEWVPRNYIQDVKIIPDYDHDQIKVSIIWSDIAPSNIQMTVSHQNPVSFIEPHDCYILPIKNKQSWSPDHPYLYSLQIKTEHDEVECYFAMRIYTIEKDQNNIPRVCLNHQPIFMNGVLDQGYWPDGLYTAPADEALIYDIQTMKDLGFNMIRKHIKIEPSRWYYHCDRLGMIVWQDMVNGGDPYHTWFITWMPSVLSWTKKHISDKHSYLLSRKNQKGKDEWILECQKTIEYLSHFPCISTWVLFNEAWGQFQTKELTQYIRQLDETRFIDSASGWFDQHCGDFRSEHHYFDKPQIIPDKRAFVISEYGGYACPVASHMSVSKVYGYGAYENLEDFSKAYHELFKQTIAPLIKQGLCGAVYTQVSDIEEEVNGLLTYDREICKLISK